MNHAIKIDGYPSVIVTFEEKKVQQLTPQGLRETDVVECYITKADGLTGLGFGVSIRAAEDVPDRYEGFRLALKRAAHSAFDGDKAVVDQLRQQLFHAMNRLVEVAPKRTPEEEKELADLRKGQDRTERIAPKTCRRGKECWFCVRRLARIDELERKAAA